MTKKKTTADWLEGKSWHRIRNEMLGSPAWEAASHLQRSMILALVGELGKHSGKNNGNLIFTNRDFGKLGFCRERIKPNLIAIRALGFIAYKAGRPGLKGYGIARRYRLTFLPILDVDGNEVEPPTDEWARFSTTYEAKEAIRKAFLRAKSVPTGTQTEPLDYVVLKPNHLTGEHNGRLSKEVPINIDVTGTQTEPLSTSMVAIHSIAPHNQAEVEPRAGLPWSTPALVEVTDPAELAAIRRSVGAEVEIPWSDRRCAYCSRPKPGPKDYSGLTVWLHERCQNAWEEAQVIGADPCFAKCQVFQYCVVLTVARSLFKGSEGWRPEIVNAVLAQITGGPDTQVHRAIDLSQSGATLALATKLNEL